MKNQPKIIYLFLFVFFCLGIITRKFSFFIYLYGLSVVLNFYILYKIPSWNLKHPNQYRALSAILILLPLILLGLMFLFFSNVQC